jgi:hypothetical protein
MLSDHERETLVELEGRLLADDPTWAMAFDATSRRMSRQRAFELTFHIVAVTAFGALTGLMLAAHAPGPALFFATVTGSLIWLIRRLRKAAAPARTGGSGAEQADRGDPGAGSPPT